MPGQRSKDKKPLQIWINKRLHAQIENEAERLGQTKTDVVTRALREHFNLDPIPASASQLDEIKTALVALRQQQSDTMRLIQEQPMQTTALSEPSKSESDAQQQSRPSFWKRLFG